MAGKVIARNEGSASIDHSCWAWYQTNTSIAPRVAGSQSQALVRETLASAVRKVRTTPPSLAPVS
eukprot:6184805-Pleurochrysis_carterae.AAC.3